MTHLVELLPPEGVLQNVEIVERKGLGHPDTICDALAEGFSAALSRFYLDRFGSILHHNVDKALLRGGAARVAFGHGEVLEPIEIYLAGRAVTHVAGSIVPVEEIARASAQKWLGEHFHALDVERHVRVHCLVRQGSMDLRELFSRTQKRGVPLANDTSIGVGYAPLSPLERMTLSLEEDLNARDFVRAHPAHGEDVKVMAVRSPEGITVTVSRAFVAEHVASLEAYLGEKRVVEERVRKAAAAVGGPSRVHVNAADAPDGSAIYLTVTGTSAESGDDGEVGRGNRANGLITPGRPMSLEALAGKNSVSHVGKLYNVLARDIAEDVVARVDGATYAECRLVSRIGAPIDEPALAHVRVAASAPLAHVETVTHDIVQAHLAGILGVSERIVAGSVRLF